jgi:succinoglycan biosynthesis transport protein ExoP
MLVATLATFLIALATVVSRELLNGQAGAPMPPRSRAGPVGLAAAIPTWHAGAAPRRERVAGLLTHGGRLGQITLDLDRPEETLADLAERIDEPPRGMAPMVVVLDGGGDGATTPRDLAELLSQRCRCIIVDLAVDDDARAGPASPNCSPARRCSPTSSCGPRVAAASHRPGRAGRDAVLAAPDLVEVALDALCETYDWVLVAAASNDDSAVLAPVAGRAQGGLVMAGRSATATPSKRPIAWPKLLTGRRRRSRW